MPGSSITAQTKCIIMMHASSDGTENILYVCISVIYIYISSVSKENILYACILVFVHCKLKSACSAF